MRSHEAEGRLHRLQSLGDMREQRALAALQRAMARHENLEQRLHQTENALNAIANERKALFETHQGLMTLGDLFQLKRRASMLESRRIELTLDASNLRSACAETTAVIAQSRLAVTYARRRRDKLTHVVTLFRLDGRTHALMKEDEEIEDHRYEH